MFSRPLLFVGVLVAAVVVPYLLLDENLAEGARGTWNRLLGNGNADDNESDTGPTDPGASHSLAAKLPQPQIEQVFRFDLTPQWVTSRWPRVSTVAGDPQQLGMRVPLVSGTRNDDIAGSLTYYFDQHHRLQRITFTGLTADPRRLLATVVTTYGLKSQPTTDAAHYIAGDPQQPMSEVLVRHLPLIESGADGARAEVSVDLRRANAMTWRNKAESAPEGKLLPSAYRRW
jgi:hypothetical protein